MVDLRQVIPDEQTAGLLDERTARQLHALPFREDESGIHVAVADPSELGRTAVNQALSGRVVFHAVLLSQLDGALDRLYRADAEISVLVKAFENSDQAQAAFNAAHPRHHRRRRPCRPDRVASHRAGPA
jgi:hypothetical protein